MDDFAQAEVDYILAIGGIELRSGIAVGDDISLESLRKEYDAVFIGVGLGAVNALGLDDESLPGIENAIEYIADLRQSQDKSALPVGKSVVVVGGGMTAIDIAVQSKRLGAERVDIVYRRGPDQMGASEFEQKLAQTNGVTIHHWAAPKQIIGDGFVTGIEFERTALDNDGRLTTTGETVTFFADVVFKAIGQRLDDESASMRVATERGRIVVDDEQRTSLDNVWAGGDCVLGGDDLTVSAVQHGKVAAISIDRHLKEGEAWPT